MWSRGIGGRGYNSARMSITAAAVSAGLETTRWPDALDDSLARADWGWSPDYDLDQMTEALLPEVKALLAGSAAS